MITHPPPTRRLPAPPPWAWRLARGWLRARAWWVCRTSPGGHPVAELIARGDWATLDRLLDALEEREGGRHG